MASRASASGTDPAMCQAGNADRGPRGGLTSFARTITAAKVGVRAKLLVLHTAHDRASNVAHRASRTARRAVAGAPVCVGDVVDPGFELWPQRASNDVMVTSGRAGDSFTVTVMHTNREECW